MSPCSILKKTVIFALVLGGTLVFAKQNVLILNSYYHGFARTDEIIKGIRDVLYESDDVNIEIERINILAIQEKSPKRREMREKEVYSMLAEKYSEVEFDVVIAIDNVAFDFVKRYGEKLWKDVPVVACGISRLHAESVDSDDSLWLGIYEFYDIQAQIDFISRMQSGVNRIIFIIDTTKAGEDIREQLSSIQITGYKDINLEEWRAPFQKDFNKYLLQLNQKHDAVVLTGANLYDSAGISQNTWYMTTEYVNRHSMAPVYSFWDIGVQNGIVGGNVIFTPLMGKNTGLLAKSILTGNNSYRLGFQKSVNIPMVDDYAAINRNLNFDNLPLETIRLNRIDSWLSRYQQYMSNMRNAIIVELVIILLLGFAFYIYFRLSNQKLLREKKAAEKVSKAKSLFLANMSHEIRTPLNSMLGFSELLLNKSGNLNEEQREWCKNIEVSSYHLRDTLNNILDFSKMEAGVIKIEEEWIDIFSLCDNLISVCSNLLFYESVRFYVMPSIYMPRFIRTDSVKLKQVLVNLVSNALKFTSEGSVKLSVECVADKIYFEVADTGIGIPKEKITRIFNAFEQIDSGHSRKYGGSGLGLTISQNILCAMGSSLEVQSSKKGSSFSFMLSVRTKEEAFYRKFFDRKNQRVAIHNQDEKVFEYLSECTKAVGGVATASKDLDSILNLPEQDLLIAEADKITIQQIQKISAFFPRAILIFYEESDRIEQIKHYFPKIEYLIAPVKNRDIISAVERLYKKY